MDINEWKMRTSNIVKDKKREFLVLVKLGNYKFMTIQRWHASQGKKPDLVLERFMLLQLISIILLFSLFLLRVDIPWSLRFFERWSVAISRCIACEPLSLNENRNNGWSIFVGPLLFYLSNLSRKKSQSF